MSFIDLDSLLAPIPGENPCGLLKEAGDDQSYMESYSVLKFQWETARKIEIERAKVQLISPIVSSGDKSERARRKEDLAGRPNDPDKTPEWRSVFDTSVRLLSEKSKDVRIVAWMAEAVVRMHGWNGLLDSLLAISKLVEAYGSKLQPLKGPDELSGVKHIDALNAQGFLDCVSSLPILDGTNVCFSAGLLAEYLSKLPLEEVKVWEQEGASTFDSMEKLVGEAKDQVIAESFEKIEKSIKLVDEINGRIAELPGGQGVGIVKLQAHLKSIQAWFSELAKGRVAATGATVDPNSSAEESSDGTAPSQAAAVPGVLRTRNDALQSLRKVAEFFRRTEPHSPLSYSLEQSIRWAGMDLPTLLGQIIEDRGQLEGLFTRIGIKLEEKKDGGN